MNPMTENAANVKKAAVTPPGNEDLSKEIEQAMNRLPDERIKVVRLFDNCYRCNWWAEDKASSSAFWLTAGTIRRSKFLRATMTSDGLVLDDGKQIGNREGSTKAE